MQSPTSTHSPPVTSEEVLAALPFAAFVVDGRADGWPLLAANDALRAIAAGEPEVGVPVADVLPLTVSGAAGPAALSVALADVRSGAALKDAEATSPDARRWRLSLSPLSDDQGVRAVLATLIEQPPSPATQHERHDVLRTMASGLVADRTRQEVLVQDLAKTAAAVGARRAVVMLSDGSEVFRVAATIGESALPARFALPPTADALIDVAMGRSQLVLPAAGEDGDPATAALPFCGLPAWGGALVVGLRVRAGGLGLLAVADPEEGAWPDGTTERLELAATLFGAALEGTELRSQFARIEELLRGAVLASTALMGHTNPAEVRRALVEHIVKDMRLAGAALWVSEEETGGAVQVAAAGLPEDVRRAVASLPEQDPVAETAAGRRPWRIPADAAPARAWPDRHLHVVPVPKPGEGALGIYTADPLPAPAGDIFAALAQAMASGVEQTTLHRQARSVVEALQRRLQPRVLDLPAGLEVGHVYRSATAGVPIGGDFLDIFATATGHIGVACGDVSGKGIEAATLSAMAVHSLRAFALQGAMPRIIVAMMDAAVEAQTGDDRFLTMAYARVQPREWTVELTNAGHPTPVIVGPDGARLLSVTVDVPVGMLGTSSYHQEAFHLASGESLVLYTDGVTEARSGHGDVHTMLGTDRLVETLDDLRDAGAQEMADAVWERVQEWSAGETTDDCAVVVLQRCPDEAA